MPIPHAFPRFPAGCWGPTWWDTKGEGPEPLPWQPSEAPEAGPWAHSLSGLSQRDGWLASTPLCPSGAVVESLSLKPYLSLLLEEATGQAQKEGRAARKCCSHKRRARGREPRLGPRQ